MLDTGSTGSLIHPNIIKQYRFNTESLPKAQTIYNADGTKIKEGITKSLTARLMTDILLNPHTFAVSEIGDDDVILELDWIKKINLIIN